MTTLSTNRQSGHTAWSVERAVRGIEGLWPAGLTLFAFRTWIALCLGFYAAFYLELSGASSVGVCVLILAQPAQGMVLSKALYRFAGTVVGAIAALTLTALFPQDRTMLLASFAVFMGLQTALGSVLRDFRSYGCILAGYTVAIISITNIDNPNGVFDSAINRVAAIFVGIVAIALTNSVFASAEASRSLDAKFRAATRKVLDVAFEAIAHRRAPDPSTCVDLSAQFMALRGQISYALPERVFGRARASGGRSALLALLEMLSASQAVGAGLENLTGDTDLIDRALEIARKALHSQKPTNYNADLEKLTLDKLATGQVSPAEAHVLDRLHFMIDSLGYLRDGLLSLRTGRRPRRVATLSVHQDWPAVAFNAARVVGACAILSVLGVWSGIPNTDEALLFTAVFVSLGAVQPDPTIMGRAALVGMPAVALVASVYAFYVFPVISGFPLFCVAWVPLVLTMCWLIMRGLGGAGLIFGVQTLAVVSPSNVETLVPLNFTDNATMVTVSGAAIFLTFLLILPVDPKQRRLRLALSVGKALRRALADEGRREQPRTSVQYDRLAQYKTWIGKAAPTLARQETMTRLVDLGNLSLAIRRAWRSLDRAQPDIAQDVDIRARALLPQLGPRDLLDVARVYVDAATRLQGHAALAAVHAGAALYGVALITRKEAHLLQRVDLLESHG